MSTYGGLMVFHENSSKQNTYLFVIFNVFWRFVYYYQQHFLMNEQVCLIYVFVWEKRVKDGFIFISDNHFWLQSSIFYPSSIRCSSSAPMFVLAPTNCCWLHSYSMAIFIFFRTFPKTIAVVIIAWL